MRESLTNTGLEKTIQTLRPECREITWIEGGDNRFVALVDGTEVFRFPKEESGKEAGTFEYKVLELVDGKLSVAAPHPIELAGDGSYNVQSFLPGNVMSKRQAADLPLGARQDIGVALAHVINELNEIITPEELLNLKHGYQGSSNRDDYYAAAYQSAGQQDNIYADTYRQVSDRIAGILPSGFKNDAIIFGDFNPANLVVNDANKLVGIIDWTGVGFGDIHRELRPIYAIVGPDAFDSVVGKLDSSLGPINVDLVRLCAVQHELAVLVMGKQKGVLTQSRTDLALYLLDKWLPLGWNK